jgi:hypothetical protein
MSLLDRKVRGFRLIDLVALGALTVLILGVYLAKTMAGSERAEIARVERQIDLEKERIRLLQAEVSHLEQPARIEHLSETYLGLGPVSIRHETTSDTLVDVMGNPNVAPASSSPIALAAAADAKAAAEARAIEAMAADQPVVEVAAADEAHQ